MSRFRRMAAGPDGAYSPHSQACQALSDTPTSSAAAVCESFCPLRHARIAVGDGTDSLVRGVGFGLFFAMSIMIRPQSFPCHSRVLPCGSVTPSTSPSVSLAIAVLSLSQQRLQVVRALAPTAQFNREDVQCVSLVSSSHVHRCRWAVFGI